MAVEVSRSVSMAQSRSYSEGCHMESVALVCRVWDRWIVIREFDAITGQVRTTMPQLVMLSAIMEVRRAILC
jgi:hypothetical protein